MEQYGKMMWNFGVPYFQTVRFEKIATFGGRIRLDTRMTDWGAHVPLSAQKSHSKLN